MACYLAGTMKTILVPIDLSPASTSICRTACELARSTGAQLVLLNVVESLPFIMNDYYGYDASLLGEIIASSEQAAARKLKATAERCRQKVKDVRAVSHSGRPVPLILDHAARLKADYIVLGSHGHGAVFDLIVGSTTQGVLRKARCPVLVVPVPASTQTKRKVA